MTGGREAVRLLSDGSGQPAARRHPVVFRGNAMKPWKEGYTCLTSEILLPDWPMAAN